MKNKLYILILAVYFFGNLKLSAQIYHANLYFERCKYSQAVPLYQKAVKKNDEKIRKEATIRLADCYRFLNLATEASIWYSKAVQFEGIDPINYYYLGMSFRTLAKYDEAKKAFDNFNKLEPNDPRGSAYSKYCDDIKTLIDIAPNTEIGNVPNINSVYSDFAPFFYKNGLIFISDRNVDYLENRNYLWTSYGYLDLYVTQPVTKNDFSSFLTFPVRMSDIFNQYYHDGPVSITPNFKEIFITRTINNKLRKDTTKVRTHLLKIYYADLTDRKNVTYKPFPYNSDKYSTGHPSISANGKKLIFSSDKAGGFGESDLYVSELNEGKWSEPVNLGAEVNTFGNEVFPFLANDSTLFFSSDGLPGFGGLDIYESKLVHGKWSAPRNMRAPINSSYDDFSIIFDKKLTSGFFSSNRPGGKGMDDIYSFSITRIDLNILCYDNQTKAILPGTLIELRSEDGKVIESKVADANGSVVFSVVPGGKYQVFGGKKDYLDELQTIQVSSSVAGSTQQEKIYLNQLSRYLTIKIIDKESGSIIPRAKLDISKGKYDKADLNDNSGIIRIKLTDNTDFNFIASAKEYFRNTASFTSSGKAPGEYVLNIELEKMSVGKQFVLEDLYYDLNKYNIRPDAAIVLDKLVKILVDNPELRIEIGSHTDCRATTEYNRKLSQKRSESVVAYLISKGIAASRVEAKGYGESQLINKCADGVKCSEAEHQANRRTVVKILSKNIKKER